MTGIHRSGADEGFTLMEVIVGMVVLGIFMSIFMGSVVSMFSSSNQSQAIARTSQQTNNAFIWLDRQVRYATYVSTPVQNSADANNWYVQFAKTDPATQQPICYQLRVDQFSKQLQQRSWFAAGSPTTWQPLATGVTNGAAAVGSSDVPFVLQPGTAAPAASPAASPSPSPSASPSASPSSTAAALPAAQLTVDLVTVQGQGRGSATSHASVTLVAFNSGQPGGSANACTGAQS